MGSREQSIVIGVPALPATLEIGLAAGHMEAKPTLYDSLVGYKLEDYAGGIRGAAIRRADRFVGRLAERWEVSEDGKTIVVTLREGVRSVAGKELDAEDVKYTLDRGFNVPGYYKWTAQVAGLASNDDVHILNKRTVRFQLATPSAFFLDTRVFPMNGIFDSALVQQHASAADPWALGWLAEHDAGFGPYTVGAKEPGVQLTFRARADYYRGKPAFDEVIYRVIEDSEERLARLIGGELDGVHGLSTAQLLSLREQPSLNVVFGPSTSVFQLMLHCKNPALRDVHVRRAIAYAIPYDQLLADVLLGVARPWRGLIPPVIDGYDESRWPYQYDLSRAKEELGCAKGLASVVMRLLGSAGSPIHRAAATLVAQALAAVGITAVPELVETHEYIRRRMAGEFDAAFSEAGPMVPDAGYALSHDFCSYSEGNEFGYSSPEVDRLTEAGLAEIDRSKRLAHYREAQDNLAADVPVVPLASPGFSIAYSRRLGNVAWYPDNVLHFGELTRS